MQVWMQEQTTSGFALFAKRSSGNVLMGRQTHKACCVAGLSTLQKGVERRVRLGLVIRISKKRET